MRTVLITAIGGDIAQGVSNIVREVRPHYRLIGVDTHAEHGGTMFVDTFHRIPPASDPSYYPALTSIIEKESVDVVVPMSEPELRVLSPLMHQSTNVQWISAGTEAIATGLDKLTTAMRLNELGIATPWTVPASEGLPPSYPCIFKGRKCSGSRSFFLVRDEQDARYLSERYPDSIYQELLEPADQEVTCAVYRTRDGRVATLQLQRRLVGGLTGWAEVIGNPAVERMCEAVAEGLSLRGSMNVQLRITRDGPRIFEINPRFSSTALMRHRLGFTDVAWSLDELEEIPARFPQIRVGGIAVRTHGAALLTE